MDGERQRRRFARAHQVPQFGKQRDGLRAGQFLDPKKADSHRAIHLLLLIRQQDLGEHIRRHYERKAGQLPKKIEAPDVRQVDEDVRICNDGLRRSNPLVSFAWDEYVRRVSIGKSRALQQLVDFFFAHGKQGGEFHQLRAGNLVSAVSFQRET